MLARAVRAKRRSAWPPRKACTSCIGAQQCCVRSGGAQRVQRTSPAGHWCWAACGGGVGALDAACDAPGTLTECDGKMHVLVSASVGRASRRAPTPRHGVPRCAGVPTRLYRTGRATRCGAPGSLTSIISHHCQEGAAGCRVVSANTWHRMLNVLPQGANGPQQQRRKQRGQKGTCTAQRSSNPAHRARFVCTCRAPQHVLWHAVHDCATTG